jgi:tetratricopeptide (TPR) repeat protein
MEAYALSGDRITSLRVYDEWADKLRQELGAAPALFVADLASRLRRRNWDSPGSQKAAPPIRTEQWRDRFFIGRAKEYRQLYHHWQRAKSGDAQLVIIAGDSGIGKTTLADRLATALALEGTNMARVRCFELERSIPYAMIGGIIESLLDRPGAAGTSPGSLAELSRVLPAVSRFFPGLPQHTDSSGEAARIRFADAMLEFFTSLVEEYPLVLVVDDFDQADETSLALLHVALRRLSTKPLLLLLIARTGRLSHMSLAKLRLDGRVPNASTLTLDPLDDESSMQLYDALVVGLPQQPNGTERRALLSAAGGFPLALELLIRDWQRSGMRAVPLAVRAMTGDVDADADAWGQQVTGMLDAEFVEPERLVVHLASVLDRRVSDLALYAAAGVPQATVLGTLSRMVEQRLLRDGLAGLEWINPTVRTHCYLLIPKALRKHFHEAVAAELLRQMSIGVAIPNLEIAWHCMRAGRHAEACGFIISGARQAIIQGAPHEAELALSTGMSAFDKSNKEEATLVLVEALLELNRPADAISVLSKAPALSENGAQTADLLMFRARDKLSQLDVTQREAIVRQICKLLLAGVDSATGVLAACTGSDLLEVYGQTSLATELLLASKAIHHQELPPADLMRLLITQARLEYIPRKMEEANRLLREAERIADAHNIRHSPYLQLLNGLGVTAAAMGHYAQGLEASRKHYIESLRAGDQTRASVACGNLALCCLRLGHYAEAIAWGRRAKEFPTTALDARYNAEECIGLSYAMVGEKEEALRVVALIFAIMDESDVPFLKRRLELAAADIMMAVGETQRAVEIATKVLTVPAEVSLDLGVAGTVARWRSLVGLHQGDVSGATIEVRKILAMPIDARDRAEALASLSVLGTSTTKEDEEFHERLRGLPSAVCDQFIRLGMSTKIYRGSVGGTAERIQEGTQSLTEGPLAVSTSQEEAAVGA